MRAPVPQAVFTVDEAYAAGWTPSALKNALRRGRVVRLRRGVYAHVGGPPSACAAIAAVRAVPRAVVSHRSAALLHDLPLLGARPAIPEITVPPRSNANVPRAHVYRARLRPQDIAVSADGELTSVARTVADLGRHRPLVATVAAMDAALHRELVTVEEIQDVLHFCSGWPGIGRGWRALKLADARAESPLESVSRLVIPALGLPVPEPQKWIFDRYGQVVGRADFYWDGFGVVGEADGRSKYTDRDVLTREKERQEAFEDLGLVVVRWGWEQATVRRHVLRARLENGLARGQARDQARIPRLWTL